MNRAQLEHIIRASGEIAEVQGEQTMKGLSPALYEWHQILQTYSKGKILSLLESPSEEATRLRSSSLFTGILTQTEREEILKTFKQRK